MSRLINEEDSLFLLHSIVNLVEQISGDTIYPQGKVDCISEIAILFLNKKC